MSSDAKSDLLKALEKEKEKTHRYETKLKDLVAAYKSQLKENETLQATIKSLQLRRKQAATSESAESDSDVPAEENSHQQEIDRLTASITELMEEKKKSQTAALAERKALKQQYEDRVQQLDEELARTKTECVTANQLATDLRKKLRGEQIEREKEQADHATILRELNKNAHDLMTERDDVKHQLTDVQKQLAIVSQQPSQTDNYEVIIADLTNQLQEVQSKLREQQLNASQQVTINELKQQIEEIKLQHSQSIDREQLRANEAEVRLQEIAGKSENRVSELESKLSQLTDMVGNYEKLRYADQQSIQKLRDRVTQLDMENTALAKVAHPEADDDHLGIDALVDRLKHVKGLLKSACDHPDAKADYQYVGWTVKMSHNPAPVILLKLGEVFMDEVHIHKKCDEEYSQLKEEYERYKLRAQSVLKNKNNKDHSNNKEVEDLKSTVSDLRERIRASADRHNTDKQSLQVTIADLRKSITNLHATHKQELSSHTLECEKKISESEQRLRQHRDRTISLLAEKDEEIEQLRKRLKTDSVSLTGLTSSAANLSSAGSPEGETGQAGSHQDSPIQELLSPDNFSSGQLIHFQEEISRNQQDILLLRKQKHELESALSELQSNNVVKQEQYEEQIALLKQEVKRLDRNQSREGVNLEYLKNIVYRYMTAPDTASKSSIFNAIATILHFSPQEKKAAQGN